MPFSCYKHIQNKYDSEWNTFFRVTLHVWIKYVLTNVIHWILTRALHLQWLIVCTLQKWWWLYIFSMWTLFGNSKCKIFCSFVGSAPYLDISQSLYHMCLLIIGNNDDLCTKGLVPDQHAKKNLFGPKCWYFIRGTFLQALWLVMPMLQQSSAFDQQQWESQVTPVFQHFVSTFLTFFIQVLALVLVEWSLKSCNSKIPRMVPLIQMFSVQLIQECEGGKLTKRRWNSW